MTGRRCLSEDVRDFQLKFGMTLSDIPSEMSPEMARFRIKFLREELDEFIHSVETGNLEGQFDALLDLVYVAIGTANIQGFPWEDGWAEVQRANMDKENGRNETCGKRGFIDPVVKPPGWRPPDIRLILELCRTRKAVLNVNDPSHSKKEVLHVQV